MSTQYKFFFVSPQLVLGNIQSIQPVHFGSIGLQRHIVSMRHISNRFGKPIHMSKYWFYNYETKYLFQSKSILKLWICYEFQQLQHLDYNILILMMAVMASYSNLLLYCYFGKMASESYEKMAHCLFESKWYEHPLLLQKYFILMIGNSQRRIYYHGFGIAVLQLETFSSVIKIYKSIFNPKIWIIFTRADHFRWWKMRLPFTCCSKQSQHGKR